MNRDDLFAELEGGPRTDTERARGYLHRKRPPRPQAPPQTEALFAELGRQEKRFVPLGQTVRHSPEGTPAEPDDGGLFPAPEPQQRRLIPIDGWRDYYRAKDDG